MVQSPSVNGRRQQQQQQHSQESQPLLSHTSAPAPARPPPQLPQVNTATYLGDATISQRGRHFVDEYHRVVNLRGFNISAASKLPTSPDGLARIDSDRWFDHRNVSFVGRPFPLEDAEYHFTRVLTWGYPFVRLLVTWEALSHSGPSDSHLDTSYISYLRQLLVIAQRVGLKVVVSSHQDVWSRLCGGSGAPGWTFEAAGMDLKAFQDTGAAYVHNFDDQDHDCPHAHAPRNQGQGRAKDPREASAKDPREVSGPFVWPSGYQKLAAGTMATLFWAGDIFAWKHSLSDPENPSVGTTIQAHLQNSYISAFGALADAVGDLSCVLGFEVMNEPHRGYIELNAWDKWCYETDLHIGHYPSLLQSVALGSGYKQKVPYYVKTWPFPTRISHYSEVDPKGRSIWTTASSRDANGSDRPGTCLWRAHGAWDWDEKTSQPQVLRQDFFAVDPRPESHGGTGQRVEWYRDCYAPFVAKFAERIRRKHSHLSLWFEPIPNEFHPPWPSSSLLSSLSEADRNDLHEASLKQRYASQTSLVSPEAPPRPEKIVYSPHFYDLNVLFSKVYRGLSVDVQGLSRGMFILRGLFFGDKGLRKNYVRQMEKLVSFARASLGEIPVLIGEIGIPFDVNAHHSKSNKAAADDIHRDEATQVKLLDALANAMEQAGVAGWAWWNYNPDASLDMGDYWNKEDFSVVCFADKQPSTSAAPITNGDAASFPSEQSQIYEGGRALDALIRPYAVRVAGIPVSSKFTLQHDGSNSKGLAWIKRVFASTPRGHGLCKQSRATFEFEYCEGIKFREAETEAQATAPGVPESERQWTVLFIPQRHFATASSHKGRDAMGGAAGEGEYELNVRLSDGEYVYHKEAQTLLYRPTPSDPKSQHPGTIHTIQVTFGPKQRPQKLYLGLGLSMTDIVVILIVLAIAVACMLVLDHAMRQSI